MSKQLPDNASLEHLKSQAKSLLAALQSNDAGAQARLVGLPIEQPFQLADAQLVIAREYGFDSWSKLKRHVESATDRTKAFFAAIRAGDRTRVQALIAEDSALVRARDEDDFGAPPITVATYRNDLLMIDLLLVSGVDVNDRSNWWAGGFGPLDLASEETSLYLLSRGATLTAHAAARLGMANELAALIAADPTVVHARGGDGQYPLHFAKTPEIVDILVDAGADLDARDVDHEGTAAQHRILDAPVLRRLVQRGATQDVFTAACFHGGGVGRRGHPSRASGCRSIRDLSTIFGAGESLDSVGTGGSGLHLQHRQHLALYFSGAFGQRQRSATSLGTRNARHATFLGGVGGGSRSGPFCFGRKSRGAGPVESTRGVSAARRGLVAPTGRGALVLGTGI